VRVGDVPGLLRELGFERVRETNKEVWAVCPAHGDSGDSWSVNRASGLHSCFACGYSGDVLGLIIDRTECTVRTALEMVHRYGVEMLDRDEAQDLYESPFKAKTTIAFVPTLRYERFEPAPDAALEDRALVRSSCDHYGVRWDAGKWILPIHSPGRTLLGWQEKGPAGVRTLPPGVEKSQTVFGAEHLGSDSLVVLVESPLDAVRLHGLGYFAVASCGAHVSDAQMSLLSTYATDIVLCLDNDEYGNRGTWSVLDERRTRWAAKLRIRVADYRVAYAESGIKDPGDMEDHDIISMLVDSDYALDWLRTHERPEKSVPGKTLPVSGAGRRQNDRQKESPRRPQHGVRKNPLRHSSGRTTNRRR
jgi:hypothetical protein